MVLQQRAQLRLQRYGDGRGRAGVQQGIEGLRAVYGLLQRLLLRAAQAGALARAGGVQAGVGRQRVAGMGLQRLEGQSL